MVAARHLRLQCCALARDARQLLNVRLTLQVESRVLRVLGGVVQSLSRARQLALEVGQQSFKVAQHTRLGRRALGGGQVREFVSQVFIVMLERALE